MKTLSAFFLAIILIISCKKIIDLEPAPTVPTIPVPPTDTASVKPLTIASFTFEKSKNAGLTTDIIASKIIHAEGTAGKVYVFVPEGTDFSKLIATITPNSGNLFYTQNSSDAPVNINTEYPANGKSIDYKYPKAFYAILKKGNESKLYQVIVDIDQPFQFGHAEVSVKDVKEGSGKSMVVTTVSNKGNHPVLLTLVNYPGRVPEGPGPIRCLTGIPSFGLKPGDEVDVTAVVNAQSYPAGNYQTNVAYFPQIYGEDASEEFLKPSVFMVKSNVVK